MRAGNAELISERSKPVHPEGIEEALTLESMSRLYRVSLAYFFGEDISLADWEVNLRTVPEKSAGQTLSGIEKAGLFSVGRSIPASCPHLPLGLRITF